MDKWLDEKVNYPVIKDYRSHTRDITNYYNYYDDEIIDQDHDYNRFNNSFMNTYSPINSEVDKEIIINLKENTRRYEADIIFRRMVDSCIKYRIYTNEGELLITPKMKQSFYKFLKENS